MSTELRSLIAGCLCGCLLLSILPLPAEARKATEVVIVEAGQPAVWSLGQAHYLLANMHQRNLDLSTRMPSSDDLDPNRINASRLEALRTALSGEVQFDESIGAKNDLERNRFRNEQVRQEQAREAVTERRKDLAELDLELLALNEELVTLQEQDRQSTERRAAATPPTPASDADNTRKLRIEVLKVRKAQKDVERARLESEVTSLNTAATTNPTAPGFQTVSLGTGGELPTSENFNTFVADTLKKFDRPSVAASIALDNFVGMQYEIISKQLTLLRDEVGPEERVIFLELPSSIYTVDKHANGYVAQVRWTVKGYYDRVPPKSVQKEVICETSKKEGEDLEAIVDRILGLSELETCWGSSEDYSRGQDYPITLEMIQKARNLGSLSGESDKGELPCLPIDQDLEGEVEKRKTIREMIKRQVESCSFPREKYDPTLSMGPTLLRILPEPDQKKANRNGQEPEKKVKDQEAEIAVRALDVIPRQSALNVNATHATISYHGILGALKWLSGFGVKVNFQRQKEMYEQFLQQEVFASGFGKGTNKFGWTFGPQPGSKRLAPGQRTTYAVLAVPRNTLALQLEMQTRVFKKRQAPGDWSHPSTVDVSVPGSKTDAFWLDNVFYAPVTKGKRATVVLGGRHFSPQLGVLVNGVPLRKVISITRAGSKEPPATAAASGIDGEFELTNSRQIVLSFGMGSDYVGTPIITFVTPSKSSVINHFRLTVNNRSGRILHDASFFEPMFIDNFSVTQELEEIGRYEVVINPLAPPENFIALRIRGKGLRPSSLINVDNRYISNRGFGMRMKDIQAMLGGAKEFVAQESTGVYVAYFKLPSNEKTVLHYLQRTRQNIEEAKFEHVLKVPFSHKVRHYRPGFRGSSAEVDLTFTSTEAEIQRIAASDGRCLPFEREGKVNYRVRCIVPPLPGRGERDFLTVKLQMLPPVTAAVPAPQPELKFVDISLPVRVVVASVVNPRTGNASGFADEAAFVRISGMNLQNVTTVLFGEQAVKLDRPVRGDSIVVKVPKVEGVPRGQSIVVPVLFQTSTEGDAKIPSGAFYTYFGQPLDPEVVYPCSPYGPCDVAVERKP